MFASQDNQLDTLTLSIGRQRDLSLRMNEELELQGELLEELDGDVERTGLRLGRASGQLERVRRGVNEHGEWAGGGRRRKGGQAAVEWPRA
ncbi:hypothetical protein BCV69DRAFT_281014 [Microstroma glucosiphilum]|uniref:t-SNARE coiled-coil homology domain-containing protein n=1 Tax=Pseudomicrostroma glucosiphilum TaxID=1684307 RepID=A0A316UGB1_9BASI|nr:hypothetical protein BCV69DRAFT_281014 [Pseudomicrostroma glucosiphilum]PWN23401.1 hypothetical protein BCV69DRAFT_281014 [Pseudomicrostroma glucosiphilum]